MPGPEECDTTPQCDDASGKLRPNGADCKSEYKRKGLIPVGAEYPCPSPDFPYKVTGPFPVTARVSAGEGGRGGREEWDRTGLHPSPPDHLPSYRLVLHLL